MAEVAGDLPARGPTRERRVFPGFTPDVAKNVMARACQAAGIAHYHPHDLRHRRLRLWHAQGVPSPGAGSPRRPLAREHGLDVYSHVLLDGDDEWGPAGES